LKILAAEERNRSSFAHCFVQSASAQNYLDVMKEILTGVEMIRSEASDSCAIGMKVSRRNSANANHQNQAAESGECLQTARNGRSISINKKTTKQPELKEFRAIVGDTSDFESSSNGPTIAK
jgi:hypothetical protein